jgi:hypothetical protein
MNVTTANYKRPKENISMATFTIDSDNNIATGSPAGKNTQSFATEKELAKLAVEWPATRLVEIWNSFAGVAPFDDLKPVKKFTNRKDAVARIWQAVQRLSADVAQHAPDVAPKKGAAKKPAAKGKRSDTAPKGANVEPLMPIPVNQMFNAGARLSPSPCLVSAPESALGLHPRIALSSAPAARSVSGTAILSNGRRKKEVDFHRAFSHVP